MSKPSIVAMGSGEGSTINFFCKKLEQYSSPPFEIKALITENPKSGLLEIARKFQIPCHILKYKKEDAELWDKELCQTLKIYQPEWIVLAGFLKKIGPVVLKEFKNKIINSHPSLLPHFSGPGMYGSKVHQAVIKAQSPFTGVSIHIVDSHYDAGTLLAQKKIPVEKGESAEELEEKVKKQEKDFYFQTIIQVLNKEISGT